MILFGVHAGENVTPIYHYCFDLLPGHELLLYRAVFKLHATTLFLNNIDLPDSLVQCLILLWLQYLWKILIKIK